MAELWTDAVEWDEEVLARAGRDQDLVWNVILSRNIEQETILNVLLRCPFVQQCWQASRVPIVGVAAMVFADRIAKGLKVWTMAAKTEVAMNAGISMAA
ncbi:hypothetical protein AgCh_037620 [Apium graveolens]